MNKNSIKALALKMAFCSHEHRQVAINTKTWGFSLHKLRGHAIYRYLYAFSAFLLFFSAAKAGQLFQEENSSTLRYRPVRNRPHQETPGPNLEDQIQRPVNAGDQPKLIFTPPQDLLCAGDNSHGRSKVGGLIFNNEAHEEDPKHNLENQRNELLKHLSLGEKIWGVSSELSGILNSFYKLTKIPFDKPLKEYDFYFKLGFSSFKVVDNFLSFFKWEDFTLKTIIKKASAFQTCIYETYKIYKVTPSNTATEKEAKIYNKGVKFVTNFVLCFCGGEFGSLEDLKLKTCIGTLKELLDFANIINSKIIKRNDASLALIPLSVVASIAHRVVSIRDSAYNINKVYDIIEKDKKNINNVLKTIKSGVGFVNLVVDYYNKPAATCNDPHS